MRLQPHLHLLIPSSTSSVQLECRLYIPYGGSETLQEIVSITTDSEPLILSDCPRSEDVRNAVRSVGIQTLVTASHPWGRLGGNMLDPVLSHHLVHAIFGSDNGLREGKTAAITYNVRGVGLSQGSSAWFTPGNDPLDFACVEKFALDLLGGSDKVRNLKRLGYSWGCISAIMSPIPCGLSSIMLVSPALSFMPIVTYFSGSFTSTVQNVLKGNVSNSNSSSSASSSVRESRMTEGSEVKIWMIYGNQDQFTGVEKYRSWIKSMEGIKVKEVEGDHFWRGDLQGEELQNWVREWLRAA